MNTETLAHPASTIDAGTIWEIDPTHSTVGFSIRHLMIASVHGHFDGFRGEIRFNGDRPAQVDAQIDAATIDTGISKRDDHLRSADFFDVVRYPTIAFHSTSIQQINSGGRNRWLVDGDLTMHGVTRTVELTVEQTSPANQSDTSTTAFHATASLNRKDFGMAFNVPVEGGGIVVGDEVKITLDIQAQRAQVERR